MFVKNDESLESAPVFFVDGTVFLASRVGVFFFVLKDVPRSSGICLAYCCLNMHPQDVAMFASAPCGFFAMCRRRGDPPLKTFRGRV